MKVKILLFGVITMSIVSCFEKNEIKNGEVFKNVEISKVGVYEGGNRANYSGLIEAKNNLPLSFITMGTVSQVFVEDGQYISKGSLLAKLNSSNAQNAYSLANLKHEQAQDAYNRLKPMKENGTLPEIKWVEIETGLNQTQAAVNIAQKNVKDCDLYAPVSGVVSKKNILPGMNILPNQTVFEILDIQTVNVNVPIPENEINKIKKGDSVSVFIASVNKSFLGSIKEIGVTADIISHTYPVKISLPNANREIKPGMICSVVINNENGVFEGVLISNKAISIDEKGKQYVYVLKDGKAEKRILKTIDLIDTKVLVEGLGKDEYVIVSGHSKIQNGEKVNVLN